LQTFQFGNGPLGWWLSISGRDGAAEPGGGEPERAVWAAEPGGCKPERGVWAAEPGGGRPERDVREAEPVGCKPESGNGYGFPASGSRGRRMRRCRGSWRRRSW